MSTAAELLSELDDIASWHRGRQARKVLDVKAGFEALLTNKPDSAADPSAAAPALPAQSDELAPPGVAPVEVPAPQEMPT